MGAGVFNSLNIDMKYLYYRLWKLFSLVKTNDMPATNAIIFLSMTQFFNLALFYILALYYLDISFKFSSKNEIYIAVGVIYSLLTFLNYKFLYKNRAKLSEKYKSESKRQRFIGNTALILYVIISFAVVFYFGHKYTTGN